MRKSFFWVLFVLLCLGTFSVQAKVKVVDGDSLEINGKRVRMQGIDAPEYMQYCSDSEGKKYDCGKRSKEELKRIIGSKPLKCEDHGKDRYKRTLMTCYIDGMNVNKYMVKNGWAVGYFGYYNKEEQSARKASKGLWQGKFMRPELYRRLHRD